MAEPVRRSAREDRGFRPVPRRGKPTLRVRTPVRPVAVPSGVVPGAFGGMLLRYLPWIALVRLGRHIGIELGKKLPLPPGYTKWTHQVDAYYPSTFNGWEVANVCRASGPCLKYSNGATGGCSDFPNPGGWACDSPPDPIVGPDFIGYEETRFFGGSDWWGENRSWTKVEEGWPEPFAQKRPERKPKYAPAEMPAIYPGIDPMGLPMMVPVDAPALPYWLQPYRRHNPNRDPLEQPTRGPLAVGRVVPGAQMTVHPVGPPTVRPRAPPVAPEPRVKEKKLIAAGLRKAVGLVTEGLDVLVVFHKALPAWVVRYGIRRGRPGERRSVGDRSFGNRLLKDLYTYWEFIDWNQALEGLVWNQIEDMIYGKIGRKLQVDHLGRGPALRQEILRDALAEMGMEKGSPLGVARDAINNMR